MMLENGRSMDYKRVVLLFQTLLKVLLNDPLYRDARNLTDTLKTRIGLRVMLTPSFNALGETRSKGQSWWDSFINPLTISEEKSDMLSLSLIDLELALTL